MINDISYNPNGMLTVAWDCMLSILPKYYHLQIYDEHHRMVLLQRLIDGEQRSIEIDIKDYVRESSSSIYIVCLNIRQNKYCRNIHLQPTKSSAVILSSTKDDPLPSLQIFYLLSGIFLGITFVSLVLIVVCCWRVRRLTPDKLCNSLEKLPNNALYHAPPHSSIFYRPLNIISYPQHQHQQQQQHQPSCDTSECSLHSSTDTSQLANDSYHIYQQIPSVYNCHMHPTRTHILL